MKKVYMWVTFKSSISKILLVFYMGMYTLPTADSWYRKPSPRSTGVPLLSAAESRVCSGIPKAVRKITGCNNSASRSGLSINKLTFLTFLLEILAEPNPMFREISSYQVEQSFQNS